MEVCFGHRHNNLPPGSTFVDTLALRLTGSSAFEFAETVTVALTGPSDHYTATPAFPLTLTLPAGATTVQSASVSVAIGSDVETSGAFTPTASFDNHPSVTDTDRGFNVQIPRRRIDIVDFSFDPWCDRRGRRIRDGDGDRHGNIARASGGSHSRREALGHLDRHKPLSVRISCRDDNVDSDHGYRGAIECRPGVLFPSVQHSRVHFSGRYSLFVLLFQHPHSRKDRVHSFKRRRRRLPARG